MDHDLVHMVAASKVPMLKPGVEKVIPPTTTKEKAQRRLKLKPRRTLLMGILNEHQLKFNSIKDDKSLRREVLDQTFDRLQKLISQLEIHGETILQEDVNQKFLRKEIDLRWQMDLLTMRARRFLKETLDRIFSVNGTETIGFDKSKVECYNCHKRGHFARECRALRNQENRNRESTRRSVPVETTTSNALISCDGLGDYDWSDQAEEGPTNFALMAYSSTSSNSEVSTDSNCSSSCLENVKILKEQNEQLLKDLRTSKLNAIAYKTGLESVEARLLVYKKNESVYEEDIKLTVENFENSSKNLSKLLDCQIIDKCKTGLGYNAVPPPYTGNFMPPKHDLSGLEEFINEPIVSEPTIKKPIVETSEAKVSVDNPKAVKKNNGALIIKDWVSDSEEEDVPQAKKEKKTVKSSFAKIEFVKSKEQIQVSNGLGPQKKLIFLPYMQALKELMEDMLPLDIIPKEGKSQAKLTNESHVLLKVPRKNNMYIVDLKNIIPKGGLTCLFAKATFDESKLWHRRLGHINKLVKGNLVRDDYSRFSWVFFLATKDETSVILKSFITGVENLIDQRVKVIRCDNGTEFKNKEMNQFCDKKSKKPDLSFMRPFGCPVTILNTIDHLGKFDGKADEGFFVGYSINSKAFREVDQISFFDIDALIKSINYKRVAARNQSNGNADSKSSPDAGSKPLSDGEKKVDGDPSKEDESNDQEKDDNVNSTNNVNTASDGNSTNNVNVVSSTVNAASIEVNAVGAKSSIKVLDDPNMLELEDIVYLDDDEGVGAEADMKNLDAFMPISPIPTTRDPRWIEAMQEELLQFKLQEFWTLVDLPNGKRAIGTKWVYRNKKDERGIMIKNKARLVAQGYTQEEGIDYDEVFALVARIEAIRLFLAYASFKDFVVYQMDVKSAFLYDKIEGEVYVCQPLGFEDPDFPDRVYKVEKDKEFEKTKHKKFQMSSMGELTFFLGLQVKQKEDGIFISQDKYVTKILKKFGFTDVKTASTHMEAQKPLLKDEDGEECVPVQDTNNQKIHLFDLVAYTDSDYAGASLDKKSTTGCCQFLGCRLISWQCKKQTVVANFTTEVEYVAASSCRGQVL
ncbi:retrovirus-related pol polyprotein from transposon TNT 1-94 [Tanacetum coccineum]